MHYYASTQVVNLQCYTQTIQQFHYGPYLHLGPKDCGTVSTGDHYYIMTQMSVWAALMPDPAQLPNTCSVILQVIDSWVGPSDVV